MHRSSVVAVLVAVIVVAGSFALGDFSAGTTRADLQSSGSTGRLGNATVPAPGPIVLHVAGEDALAGRLETELAAELGARGYSVTVADALRADYGDPVLVVGVVDRSLRYDPVAPDGRLTWRYLLVGSGNLSRIGPGEAFDADEFRERLRTDDLGVYRLDDATGFVRAGTLELHVAQRGLVSAPAFRGTVVETAANRTVDVALAPA
jgi:hypothetical protein